MFKRKAPKIKRRRRSNKGNKFYNALTTNYR